MSLLPLRCPDAQCFAHISCRALASFNPSTRFPRLNTSFHAIGPKITLFHMVIYWWYLSSRWIEKSFYAALFAFQGSSVPSHEDWASQLHSSYSRLCWEINYATVSPCLHCSMRPRLGWICKPFVQLGTGHHSLSSEGMDAQDYEVCMRAVSIFACVMCVWQVSMGYCANLSLYEYLWECQYVPCLMCVDVWVYMHGYRQAPGHQLSSLLSSPSGWSLFSILPEFTKPESSKYFKYQQNILYFSYQL